MLQHVSESHSLKRFNNILVCIYSIFVYSSVCICGLFSAFAMNNAVMNIGVQVCVCESLFSILFGIYLKGIAGSYDNSISNCLRNCQIVFNNKCTILHSHQQCKRFHFPYILKPQTLVVSGFFFLDNNHPNECEVLSHCHFDLHFPMTNNVQHLFLYLFTICIS